MLRELVRLQHMKRKYVIWRDNRGAAAIEMALVLPILVVLVLGIMEFGILMFSQQVIVNASREGARQGIVLATPRPTEGDVENVVANYLTTSTLDGGLADVTVEGAGGAGGTNLTVSVNYPYQFIALNNFVPGLPDPFPLTASTTMVLE